MIGISTLAFSNAEIGIALSEIEKRANHAEIFSEGLHDVIHSGQGEVLPSYALSYSIHAPTQDINLASPRRAVREAGVEIIRDSAFFCMNRGIDVLVVHPGYVTGREMLPQGYEAFEKSLADLGKIKEETGVRLCIENMPNAETYLFRNPDDIDLSGLELILDIGHAHTAGNLAEFLEKPIAHYHIHDNDGSADAHRGFGDGTVGRQMLEKIVGKAKKEKALLIAENKTIQNAEKTVDALKKANAE